MVSWVSCGNYEIPAKCPVAPSWVILRIWDWKDAYNWVKNCFREVERWGHLQSFGVSIYYPRSMFGG